MGGGGKELGVYCQEAMRSWLINIIYTVQKVIPGLL